MFIMLPLKKIKIFKNRQWRCVNVRCRAVCEQRRLNNVLNSSVYVRYRPAPDGNVRRRAVSERCFTYLRFTIISTRLAYNSRITQVTYFTVATSSTWAFFVLDNYVKSEHLQYCTQWRYDGVWTTQEFCYGAVDIKQAVISRCSLHQPAVGTIDREAY